MRKELPKIIIIFLMTVGVVVWGLNYIFLGSAPKSKAADETVSLSFNPATASGQNFTATIKAQPSTQIAVRGYQFKVAFDKAKVSVTTITYKLGSVSSGLGDTDPTTVNNKGYIYVQGEIQAASPQIISSLTDIIDIGFSSSTTASSTVTISDASISVVDSNFVITPLSASAANSLSVNGNDPAFTPTPTVNPTVTPGGPTLTPTPIPVRVELCQSATVSKTTLSPGESLTITSTAKSSDIKLFTYAFYNLGNLYPTPPANNPKPIFFTANTHYVRNDSTTPPVTTHSITVTYDELNKEDLNWNNSKPTNIKVNAYFVNSKGEISVPEDNCNVKFNITQAGNVNLKMKLKFQGITGKRPTDALGKLNVKVQLFNEISGKGTDYKTAEFIVDDQGVWSGQASFDVNTNDRYLLYAKGPYHIQKKICDERPTETAGGTYRCDKGKIILNSGENNLDLSGVVLLTGDLPDQDGTINAYDTSLIRNNLGKTDNDKCDVNRDSKCDTQDYSLVISALSVKNDEL